MNIFVQRLQKLGSFHSWRNLVNFWSFVFFAAIVFDFLNANILSENEILLAISGIYCAALAVYSAEKEFRRWHHMHSSIHPGEIYSIMWTVLIIGVIVGTIVYDVPYKMPIEVSASYIAVLSVLAITRESKNFYKKRKKA